MIPVAVIDNYDSFTYNLVHYLEAAGATVTVFRNDDFALHELEAFHKILLSPGPGLPCEAGLLLDVIRAFARTKSILGVCLGLQAIGEVYGGQLSNLGKVQHGKATQTHILVANEPLFEGLPQSFTVGRYHSWVLDRASLPLELEVTAVDDAGVIMAICHKTLDVKGVQFHPESVLTPQGMAIISNWLKH